MDNFTRLKEECDLLRKRIREFEKLETDENSRPIVEMQIAFLRKKLTRVGHQLRNLAIARGIYDD